MDSFIAGSISGFFQIIVGHPLDTYKVWLQTNQINKIKPNLNNLYRGIRYPLYSNCLLTSILFCSNDYVSGYCKNQWITGAFSGIATSIICCPVDVFKITSQNKVLRNISYIRGYTPTLYREILGNSIYFGGYDYLYNKTKYSSFVSGGLAGVASWFITHPIDTVKTRIQSYRVDTIKQALLLGNIWNGVGFSITRAFIVNSVGFYVYQNILDIIRSTELS